MHIFRKTTWIFHRLQCRFLPKWQNWLLRPAGCRWGFCGGQDGGRQGWDRRVGAWNLVEDSQLSPTRNPSTLGLWFLFFNGVFHTFLIWKRRKQCDNDENLFSKIGVCVRMPRVLQWNPKEVIGTTGPRGCRQLWVPNTGTTTRLWASRRTTRTLNCWATPPISKDLFSKRPFQPKRIGKQAFK